jgi:hypothetical protein
MSVGAGSLYRSYLKFTVSQDSENQTLLSPSQFATLDLYQIDALRDADDPFVTNNDMQGATLHFPSHVFWSKELSTGAYAVWGRRAANHHEEETVLRMLEAQRKEREEYKQLVNERRWQRDCERKMREDQLKSSAARSTQRANTRRASEAPAPGQPPATGRIASIVHRILRREGSETLSEAQTASLVNRGLRRLGMRALAVGSVALVSAVAYLNLLQGRTPEGEDSSLGLGILASPPYQAAQVGGRAMANVTDRVFAAHEAKPKPKPARMGTTWADPTTAPKDCDPDAHHAAH